jgi:hypothetical protein
LFLFERDIFQLGIEAKIAGKVRKGEQLLDIENLRVQQSS